MWRKVPCFLKGSIFIKRYILVNFNLPSTRIIYSKCYRILTISNKHTVSSRGFQLVSFVLQHMEIYRVQKDTKMPNIKLDTCEHSFWVLVVQFLMRHLVLKIHRNIHCFSPKELEQILIMEHGTSNFYNGLVFSFSYSILFDMIGNGHLFLDTFLLAKIDELI